MTDVLIDALLLRHLRAAEVADDVIAAQADGVLRHNARAQRFIGDLCSGDASFEDDVVMCAVRLAHGIHWCGGHLRINARHVALPATIAATLVGRPIGTLIEHPLLDPALVITGVHHEDETRFDAGGGYKNNQTGVPSVLVVETDARPETVATSMSARIRAPWMRVWTDQALAAQGQDRDLDKAKIKTFYLRTMVVLGVASVIMGCAVAYATSLEKALIWSGILGVVYAVIWLPPMVTGMTYKDQHGFAHLAFVRAMRLRQDAEGMRD